MTDSSRSMKSMKLYVKADRILNDLKANGIDPDGPLQVSQLTPFDQYHYHGTKAVDLAIAAMHAGPGKTVLEIGSGIGGPARYCAMTAGCQVTAVELQRDLNTIAERLTRQCGLAGQVRHVCADILNRPVDSASFDAAMSFLCFFHIPDQPALFARCHDALKPGGRIVIEDLIKRTEPTGAQWQALKSKVQAGHLSTLGQYRDFLTEAGFINIDITDMSDDWTSFTRARLAAFRDSRQRYAEIHGEDVADGMDEFYSAICGLFADNTLGGVRVIAQRAA